MADFTFCTNCGTLKELNKICKACTNIMKTEEKSNRILRDLEPKKKSQILKSEYYKQQMKMISKKKKQYSIKYSEANGIEWYFEADDQVRRTKLYFCIKCKQNKLCYSGNWVRAGGKYASLENKKRIFICYSCWKPKKAE